MSETYRLLAHKLRINRPGEPDFVPERPRKPNMGAFLDSDDNPTLVEFRDTDAVDIPSLLAIGAIAPLPAKGKAKPKPTVGDEVIDG